MAKKKEGDFQRFLFFHSFLLCLCKPLASELFAPQAMQLGKPRVVSSWLHRDDSLLVTAPEYPAQGLKKIKGVIFTRGPFFPLLYSDIMGLSTSKLGWLKQLWQEGTVAQSPSFLPLLFFFSSLHSWALLYMATPTCVMKTFLDSQDDKVRKYKAFVS